jgi:DNA-binding CsgD family transcriptional regulator
MTQTPSLTVDADLEIEFAADAELTSAGLTTAALTPFLLDEHRRTRKRECIAALLEALPQSIAVVDPGGTVTAATHSWHQLMKSRDQSGQQLDDVVADHFGLAASRRVSESARRVAVDGRARSVDVVTGPSGHTVTVTCTPVPGPVADEVEEVVVSFQGEEASVAKQSLTSVPDIVGVTSREHDVLRLLAEGMTIPLIADRLKIREHTVRGHLKALMHKLDAHTQLQVVLAGVRLGLVHLDR